LLRFYNTLTRSLSPFEKPKDQTVLIYTCGPTVYNFAHLGNLRAYVFADLLIRTLNYFGYRTKRVLNITDVGHLTSDADSGEDKVEKEAQKERKSAWQIAREYEKAFFEDWQALNLLPPDIIARATEHIKEQITLIQRLEKRGYTYRTSDGIYFDTSKLADYGKLWGQDRSQLLEGSRVEKNPEKKNPTDFALWKFSPKDRKRDMEWDSPWGRGFPGWHIECSAMAMKHLGETIDIHTGGVDHIAIHHTNEIAQSEAATGKPFARFFLHNEFLVGKSGKKMAKSQGVFLSLKEASKRGFEPLAFRYLCLTVHYRDKLHFSFESLASANEALKNLWRFAGEQKGKQSEAKKNISAILKEALLEIEKELACDLNSPRALAKIWEIKKRLNAENLKDNLVYEFLLKIDKVLGLKIKEKTSKLPPLPKELFKLLKLRDAARKEKDFKKADEIRSQIEAKGFKVEDVPDGVRLIQDSKTFEVLKD